VEVAIAGDVEIADEDSRNVQVTGIVGSPATGILVSNNASSRRQMARARAGVPAAASSVEVVDDIVNINSDEDSSASSDSGSSSRSRSQRRNKSVGAAAATALLSAAEPLELDTAGVDVQRELILPTSFAAGLQHKGDLVAIMVETGSQISILPLEADPSKSVVRISGGAHAVGRATASVEVAHEDHKRALSAGPVLGRLEVPSAYLGPVVGANGEGLLEVREKCGGIMIALMPAEQPGGPTVAVLGPGDAVQVSNAERELRSRLLLAEAAAEASAHGIVQAVANGSAKDPADVAPGPPMEKPSNSSNGALAKPATVIDEVGSATEVAARSAGECLNSISTSATDAAAAASATDAVLPSTLGSQLATEQQDVAGFEDVD